MHASSEPRWYASPWADRWGCTSRWIIQVGFRALCCRARREASPHPRSSRPGLSRSRSRTSDLDRTIPWNEPHLALAADAFERDPSMAFLYRMLSGVNPPIGDTGTGDMGISPSRLGSYDVPTLMISGVGDRIFPPAILEDASKVIPGAQLHSIPLAGHSPYFETPDDFNRVVGEFVSKHGSENSSK